MRACHASRIDDPVSRRVAGDAQQPHQACRPEENPARGQEGQREAENPMAEETFTRSACSAEAPSAPLPMLPKNKVSVALGSLFGRVVKTRLGYGSNPSRPDPSNSMFESCLFGRAEFFYESQDPAVN